MNRLSSNEHQAEVIPSLQSIQEKMGYISPEAVSWLADKLRLSEQEIYGVATFYAGFKFTRPGRHDIKVCMGTACFVQGGERLLTSICQKLGVKPGETTADNLYSLERIACLGCCALSPVVRVDGEVHGRMTQRKVSRLLEQLAKEDKQEKE